MLTKESIHNHKSKIQVFGLGYVGLPLALLTAKSGYCTIGVDSDHNKIESLSKGKSYVNGVQSKLINKLLKSNQIEFTSRNEHPGEADILIVSVPTPLDSYREPDMSYIRSTLKEISDTLRKGQLILIESTLYPRATEDEILPLLVKNCDLKPGEDYYLVFAPERIDPGNKSYGIEKLPKIVGALTQEGEELAVEFYKQILNAKVFPVSSPRVAEMAKLLENVFRNVNIALVNEMSEICNEMEIDIWEVIEAAKTKPYGFMPFYPGPGVGGHCIPVDPFFVSWKAREYEKIDAKFVELAGQINRKRPQYVVSKLTDLLNEHGKSLKGSKILMLGITYKKDVQDIRGSPGITIIDLLLAKGALVVYNDPYIPKVEFDKLGLSKESVQLDIDLLSQMDCVLIVTDHSEYDYSWIVEHSQLVLDTRNATSVLSGEGKGQIVRI